jgi:hypothetical protein
MSLAHAMLAISEEWTVSFHRDVYCGCRHVASCDPAIDNGPKSRSRGYVCKD